MLKKVLMAIALALPMLASAQGVKIGVVDAQAIFTLMPETKTAQEQLLALQKRYEDEYTKMGEQMNRLATEVQNLSENEPAAIKERKTREYQEAQVKMHQFLQSVDQDLQQKHDQLMEPIYKKLNTAIEAVGAEGGFGLVFPKGTATYVGTGVADITAQVKTKLGL